MSGIEQRRRGLETERLVVRWLIPNGFPGAERIIRTGWQSRHRQSEDCGDIALCPGLIAQVKSLRPVNRAERMVDTWMAQTEAQRAAAGADVALLVVRREGCGDVGDWWAWLTLDAVRGLFGAGDGPAGHLPIRMLMRDAVAALRAAGYGDTPTAPELTALLGADKPEQVAP